MASPINRCTLKLNSDKMLYIVFIVAWLSGHKIGVYIDMKCQQQLRTYHSCSSLVLRLLCGGGGKRLLRSRRSVNFKGKDCISHTPHLELQVLQPHTVCEGVKLVRFVY